MDVALVTLVFYFVVMFVVVIFVSFSCYCVITSVVMLLLYQSFCLFIKFVFNHCSDIR